MKSGPSVKDGRRDANTEIDMEVLSINEMFVDDEKVDHLGILSIHKMNHSRTEQQCTVFTFPFQDEDDTEAMDGMCSDIQRIFVWEDENIAGWIMKGSRRLLIVEFCSDGSPHNGSLSEIGYFIKLWPKIRSDLQLEFFNKKGFKRFLTDPANALDGQMIFDQVISRDGSKIDSEKFVIDTLQRSFFRPFVYFMLENHHLDEKECEELINSVDHIPKYVKSLGWTRNDALFHALCGYLKERSCRGPGCDGFGLSFCKNCREAHYCSKECQTRDWKVGGHKSACKILWEFKAYKLVAPSCVDVWLEQHLQKELNISIVTFSKMLMGRVYEGFHGCLEDPYLLHEIQNFLNLFADFPRGRERSSAKMLTLLKINRKSHAQSLVRMRNHLNQAYGPMNTIVQMMKRF